jgi:acyl dehydratase
MTAPAVGPEWSVRQTITQADLDGFAAVSGDDNPIHVNADYAAATPFRRPVAHGMFLFSLVRAQVRKHWPDARCAGQRLRFSAPTPAGSTVTIRLWVEGRDVDGLHVGTTVTGPDGSVGLDGECRLEFGRDGAS